MKNFILITAVLSVWPLTALALDSFSYSGRLVNNNGSPVAGPVDLRFDLSSTVPLTGTLCTKTISGVQLSQGVFHVKLKFDPADCGGDAFQDVMESVPANQNMTYQVTDITNSRTYAVQNMYAVPSSFMANFAKNLPQMGALPNQVLKWDDSLKRWVPGSAGTGDGSVKSISTDSSLTGGPITDTGTLAVAIGGITNAHLAGGIDPAKLAGTRDGTTYLKGDNTWSTFGTDVLGTILTGFSAAATSAVTATDSILAAFGKLQGQVDDLEDNKLSKTGGTLSVGTINGVPVPLFDDQVANKKYVDDQLGGVNSSQWLDAVPHIYFNTGNVGIGTGTPGEKLEVVGNVALTGRLRLKDSGSNFVELRAPVTTAGVTFVLPASAGSNGQVLKTDGTGTLSWGNSSVGSSDITDGSIVDADVAAAANIAQSKIANLTSDLAGKEPSITAGTTAQYWRGDKTWQALTTDAVVEGTNKYFTNSLARAAISATAPINFNNTTGVLALDSGTTGDLLRYDGTSWVPWAPNFLTSEADTLATVTARGSTTSTAVTLSGGASFPNNGVWNASGSVGIGINAPTSLLDVVNTNNTVPNYLMRLRSATTNGVNTDTNVLLNFAESNGSNVQDWVLGTGSNTFFGHPDNFGLRTRTYNWNAFVVNPSGGGRVYLAPAGGRVGIGTSSARSTLDVAGGIQIGNDAAACDASKVGTLRYTGGNVEYCNGTAWAAFGVSGAGGTITALTGDVAASGNGSVAATIANDAVTSAKILDGTIVNADIANSTITYGKLNLADGSIPVAKLVRMTCLPGEVITSDAALGYRCVADNSTDSTKLPLAGGTMTGAITLAGDPTANLHAATKQYVDTAISGIPSGVWSTSGTNIYNNNSGNVGVGTSSPTSKLHVSGDAFVEGAGSVGVKLNTSNGSVETFGGGFVNPRVRVGNNVGGVNKAGIAFGDGSGAPNALIYRDNATTIRTDSDFLADSRLGVGGQNSSYKLYVFNGTAGPAAYFTSNGATNRVDINVGRTAPDLILGAVGTNNDYFTGTSAGDVVVKNNNSSGNIFIGNSNGTLVMSNSGNLGVGTAVPGAKLEVAGQVKITGGVPGAGKVLTSDAAGLASWTTIAPGGVTSVSGTAPVTVTGTTTPVVSMAAATSSANGYLTSADWTTFNNKLGTATSFSGDVTGTYNSTSVDRIKGTAVTITTLTSGNLLRYNGTAWVNAMLAAADIPNLDASKITTGVLPVARGGTNLSSLNGNRVMLSNAGATALVEAPAMTNGQLLIGSTGNAPVASTLTAGTGVTITNSTGGITIAAAGSGGTITALTGDVTASGSGSVAATIANDAVTSAKILDGTIVNADIANSTITYGKLNLADGSIPVAKLVRMACLPTEVLTSDVALGYRCVSAADSTKLPLAGGTMTGAITLSADPTANLHAATKQYVDAAISSIPAGLWSTTGANIYKNNTGNVGIGITAPLVPLHIQSTSTTTISQMGITAPNLTAGNGTTFGIGKNWSPGEAFSIGYYHETAANDRYMGIQWFGASPNLVYTQGGNLGVGTTTPGAKLEVAGQVKITGGTPGAGKVLTSDAAGLATWTTPAGGTGDFMKDGSVAMTGQFKAIDGDSNTPSITFAADTGTGFFRVGNYAIGLRTTSHGNLWSMGNSIVSTQSGGAGISRATGTAAAPAFFFQGDGDTGMFSPTTNVLAFTTNGVEKVRINSAGDVGIGVTSPGAKLDVAGQIKISGGSPGAGKVLTSDASGLATWQTAGGGTPAGSNTQVQYNNSGAFGASSNFTYDGTTLNATTGLDAWGLATIVGENTQTSNNSEVYGVKGVISNPYSTDSAGVYGVTLGSGHGVLGRAGPYINSAGVMGINSSTENGWGVYGISNATTGSNSGVYGYAVSANGYGGVFSNLNGWALYSDGNFGISADSYLNWGTTRGISGYGLRDNSGVIECKNSGGSWAPCAGGSGVSGSGTATYIPKFTATGTVGNSVILEDASNRIGIGGSPTNYRLEIFNNINNTHGIWVKNNSTGTTAGSQIALSIGATNSVGGNLGVNSSGVSSDLANRLAMFTQPTTVTGISIAARNAGQDVRFYTGGSFERMRLDASGNLSIGTTSTNSVLTVAGVVTPSVDNTHTLGNATYRWSAVHATNGTIQTSDKRLKKDISVLSLGEDFINSLNPVQYRWKTEENDKTVHFGFIAQDVDKKLKDQKVGSNGVVNYDKASDRFGVNYSELIAPIVKSIQELFQRLKMEESNSQKIVNEQLALRKEIERLKTENAEMKVMMKELLRKPSNTSKHPDK